MANKDIEYTVHDYGPLNKAIDENLRINIDTLLIPDPINKTQSEQAF